MTKKKRGHPDVEEQLQRPWCYYCERSFDDLKILINHQKAKHFKCERCGRRLNTAGGLSVHMSQVHKENLTAVDNALPNRAGLDIEIFGMEGIPEDIVAQHRTRVLTEVHQQDLERRAANGNPAPGIAGANPTKKPKLENPSDLKKRLAEHKARLAAEQNGGSSGDATPTGAGETAQAAAQTTQEAFQVGSANYPSQQPYSAPPPLSGAVFGQPTPYPQPQAQAPSYPQQSASPFQPQPLSGYNPQQPGAPHHQQPGPPYQQPPQPYPQPAFSPPPYQNQPYQQQQPYTFQPPYHPQQNQPYQAHYQPQPYSPQNPSQGFPPQPMHNGPLGFQGPHGGPPRPFSGGPPGQQFHQQQFQPPHGYPQASQTPPQHNPLPQRSSSGSLPAAPGLPQRPSFGAPQVNGFQFHQMHQGQAPTPSNPQVHQQYSLQNGHSNGYQPSPVPQPQVVAPPPGLSIENPEASSLEDLISNASKQAEASSVKQEPQITVPEPSPEPQNPTKTVSPNPSQEPPLPAPPVAKEEHTDDKTAKKEKEKEKEKPKSTRLVYPDNEISPEEKMASMARYAFIPERKTIAV